MSTQEIQDTPMPDASTQEDPVLPDQAETYDLAKSRLRVLPGSSETAASFEFIDEDHTLGNALRYMIMKNPQVEFCAYSIPHPSEAKMNVRIQTYDGYSVYDALEKGFNDLADLCDVVTEKYTQARADFTADQARILDITRK